MKNQTSPSEQAPTNYHQKQVMILLKKEKLKA